jgi:carboxypeptidase Q
MAEHSTARTTAGTTARTTDRTSNLAPALSVLRTRTLVLLAASAAAAVAGAAAAPAAAQEPIDHEMIALIRAEGTDRSRAGEVFHALTTSIGPRLAGSPAYDAAASYARDWLAGHGLTDARLEGFEFGRGWSLERLELDMVAPRYARLIGYAEAWTPSTRGVVQGRPVYVGELDAAQVEALGERLRGAIVLANAPQAVFTRADRPQPTASDEPVRTGAPPRAPGELGSSAVPFNQLARLLQQAGAAAVLRPSRGEHGTVFVLGNRNTPDDAVPSLILAAEHYNELVRLAQTDAPVELRIDVRTRYHDDDPLSWNVLAELPGTDPLLRHEVVLLGAHLDSWHAGAGAVDNADGVAVSMEAMRILRAVGAQPRRTIRIALWGGEEQGLLGSRAYVERHLAGAGNVAAHEALSVYLNDDPGTGPTYGWYMEGNAAAKQIFDAWLEPLRELGLRRNVMAGLPSTDHLSFTRVGIPGFSAIKDYTDYDTRTHHTNMDTPERVRAEDLRQAAIVLASFAWHAAMRDERMPRMP